MPLGTLPPPPEPIVVAHTPPHVDTASIFYLFEYDSQEETSHSLVLDWQSYFRNLKDIRPEQRYVLPSNNQFMVDRQGIHLRKSHGQELRGILAENKWATIIITDITYTSDWWRCCLQGKKRWICIDQDPQVLGREELAKIFFLIDQGKTYRRPEYKPDGKSKYETILVVHKVS